MCITVELRNTRSDSVSLHSVARLWRSNISGRFPRFLVGCAQFWSSWYSGSRPARDTLQCWHWPIGHILSCRCLPGSGEKYLQLFMSFLLE